MCILVFLRALTLCALTFLLPAHAQTYPEDRDLYINDYAGLLPAAREADLRDVLRELREVKGIEFTVLTIDRMSEYGHSGAIEPFATALFNEWGIGDAQRNDGVLLLVSRYDRVLRIEVGAGYGTRMNAPMQDVIDNTIVPRFRRDEYADGIEAGVRETIRKITGRYPGEYDSPWLERTGNGLMRAFDAIVTTLGGIVEALGAWIFAILAPLAAFPYRWYRRWRRDRPRKCPVDGMQMRRLNERWDNERLEDGQVVEEQLKSVDYDVWECPACDNVTIEAYRAWFSRYGACPSCSYRTLHGRTTILRNATTSSTGEKRIDYSCKHCDHEYSEHKTIPRKSKSRSSSGSSSSRGGGRSSGGGASGSW